MGIYRLWADLREAGLVVDLAGKDCEREIAQCVDGLTIAVDVSIWMVQASMQPNLAEVFASPLARVLKVCFDRVSRMPTHHTSKLYGDVSSSLLACATPRISPLSVCLAGKSTDLLVPSIYASLGVSPSIFYILSHREKKRIQSEQTRTLPFGLRLLINQVPQTPFTRVLCNPYCKSTAAW